MNLISAVKSMMSRIVGVLQAPLDVRDVLVFGGLAMLGYGLHLLYPWLAFTVCGVLLMGMGLFVGRRGA